MKNTSRIVLSVFVALVLVQCKNQAVTAPPASPKGKTLLAIFAHPDDEATVSPVLSKYAAEGVEVYLVVATDGRLGVAEHAKIPGGDSLAHVRKRELACATEKLGIHAPIMFGLHDQLKMGEGMAALNEQLDSLRRGVQKLFVELKPDVVITWNASGWTGHHDHRLVGAIVTEVFESRQWEKPTQLYYSAIPSGRLPKDAVMQLATVDSSFLPVKIAVTETDYQKAKESWLCHKSQYTPEMIDAMTQLVRQALNGSAWFQPAIPISGKKETLF
ncbi:MAG: PIG-L family deacetylase [Bacteroidetes bacterium]|nr:PIG-L family deacetylase [Bacteroidota bacterium]